MLCLRLTIAGVNLDFCITAVGATPSDRKVVDWEFKEYIKCVRAKWLLHLSAYLMKFENKMIRMKLI